MRFRAVFGVVLPVRLFCQSPEVAAKQGGRLRVLRSGCGHQVAGEKKQNKTCMFFDFKKQPRFCFATQRTGVFSFLARKGTAVQGPKQGAGLPPSSMRKEGCRPARRPADPHPPPAQPVRICTGLARAYQEPVIRQMPTAERLAQTAAGRARLQSFNKLDRLCAVL